jgi:RIO-like serine/threonine protein kinase
MGNKASGAGAYSIKLIPENIIGRGNYADIYKIKKKDTKEWCAAKFHKLPISFFSSLDKLGYDREL